MTTAANLSGALPIPGDEEPIANYHKTCGPRFALLARDSVGKAAPQVPSSRL
jgi:hypothetical protein